MSLFCAGNSRQHDHWPTIFCVTTSLFDLYKLGVGPSSSHTMGPMRAACRFSREVESKGELENVSRVQVKLFGSLALTGMGHGTDRAVLLGLSGNEPATIDPAVIEATVAEIRASKKLALGGKQSIRFEEARDLIFERETMFPPGAHTRHPNGLRLAAYDGVGNLVEERTYFSIGGGFIVEDGAEAASAGEKEERLPYPFHSAAELLELAQANGLRIDQVMMANECARIGVDDPGASEEALAARVRTGIEAIWQTMKGCVERGIATEGILPGGLNVRRRAHRLTERLKEKEANGQPSDPLAPLDWVTVYAIAVNVADSSLVWPQGLASTGSHPAKAGDVLIIYATGLGMVDHTPADGGVPSVLANTIAVPTVMFGGVAGTVEFSGLAPQFVGVNQLNVQVPAGVKSGSAVPLQIQVNGFTSTNQVVVAIQ